MNVINSFTRDTFYTQMLMAGLILCLYLSTYAFLMLTFCRV